MNKPFILYDVVTLKPIELKWAKELDNGIEIDRKLAEDFILGNERLLDWKINDNNGTLEFIKDIKDEITTPIFWSLLDSTSKLPITLTSIDSAIKVETKSRSTIKLNVYATLKNDPSWLIQSWKDIEISQEFPTVLNTDFTNFDNYSYYIDINNET